MDPQVEGIRALGEHRVDNSSFVASLVNPDRVLIASILGFLVLGG